MGQNVTRAQELQEELAKRRASLLHDSAKAHALKGQEALLAEIVEEMAHKTQVLVLLHLHLQQAEEIKAQSEEIKRLSTLLERQQTILEQVQEQQQSSVSQVPRVQPTTSQLNELQREAFNILPGTVNARCGTGIKHLSGLNQNIPVAGKAYFEDELAEEATWGSHHLCHVCFASSQKRGLTSTPLNSSVKVGEDNTLIPQQRRARESLMNSAMCPSGYKIWMAVQEICKNE